MFLLLLHRGAPNREGESLPRQLLRFCQEIADGMQYLSKKGFIHRDLAARNILLTADTKCKVKGYSGLSIIYFVYSKLSIDGFTLMLCLAILFL